MAAAVAATRMSGSARMVRSLIHACLRSSCPSDMDTQRSRTSYLTYGWKPRTLAKCLGRVHTHPSDLGLYGPTGGRGRVAGAGDLRVAPGHGGGDLLGHPLPLVGVPALRRRHESCVLAEVHERGEMRQPEALHERAVGIDEREVAVLGLTEDAARDEVVAQDAERGAAVGV